MRLTFNFQEQKQCEDAKRVATLLYHKIVVKNLFGWRYYIEEVIEDAILYMVKTEFKFSVGLYVYSGMCLAINQARYCSAQKRRHNFECTSWDECFNIADKKQQYELDASELYIAMGEEFGFDLADKLKEFIYGNEKVIDKSILKKVRNERFKEFLELSARE